MAVETAADLAAFFDTDEFAVAATYYPAGGAGVAVSVIHDAPYNTFDVAAEAGIARVARRVLLRAGELACDPAPGDVILLAGANRRVMQAAVDDAGSVWSLELQG